MKFIPVHGKYYIYHTKILQKRKIYNVCIIVY
jgi:hypothetical protein